MILKYADITKLQINLVYKYITTGIENLQTVVTYSTQKPYIMFSNLVLITSQDW